jgi:hypothetical protein
LIKEESTSELLRFKIRHILNQLCDGQIYLYLEQEQQEQKKDQNNRHQKQHVSSNIESSIFPKTLAV